MKQLLYLVLIVFLYPGNRQLYTAETNNSAIPDVQPDTIRWQLNGNKGIIWKVNQDTLLPHQDHIEMSGRHLSAIIRYSVDSAGQLALSRQLIWPMLRIHPKPTDPEWFQYRAYLKRTYEKEINPVVTVNGKTVVPGPLSSVIINGFLVFKHLPQDGISIIRMLFPSMDKPVFIEYWEITNSHNKPLTVEISTQAKSETENGIYGEYIIQPAALLRSSIKLKSGKSTVFPIQVNAHKSAEAFRVVNVENEIDKRKEFINQVTESLILTTPDSVLNRAFALSKIRAAESLFQTKMGLVHSPGGGNYYGGVWANDQVEYAGPYFPFLGYTPANEASLNAYRKFASVMQPDYKRIPSSFEMEGDLTCCSKDRGDAAMYAFGASRFALALGNREVAEELWPAIEWSIEYNRRRTTPEGVIASESDEMEGRLPTGKANLSASSLAYGGLRSAADLARALGKKEKASLYDLRADSLKRAIENYFGATVEGFETYAYFKGHETLRYWISLPLTMGILDRKEGTINALLTKLWTPNGLAVQTGSHTFWDRGTLYALRGIFNAGETEKALLHLKAYTQKRLLGNHVPYPVEAFPEGGQAHLSAESALYGRIYTEGMFGIVPTGLQSFSCTPHLPQSWPSMKLEKIKAFGSSFDLLVSRENKGIQVRVVRGGKVIFNQTQPAGATFQVTLK